MTTQMNQQLWLRRICTVSTALFGVTLTGCGGGGDAGPASAQAVAPSTTNVAAALQALLKQPHSFALAGSTSTGVPITASLSVTQSAAATYQNVNYDVATVSISVRSGVNLLGTSSLTIWFTTGTVGQFFLASSADGNCDVAKTSTVPPTSAALGQSGPYNTMTALYSCNTPTGAANSLSFISGTRTQTWSYEVIKGIPMVCINSSLAQLATTTESDCIEVIDANGTLGTRVLVTSMNANKVTMSLSN